MEKGERDIITKSNTTATESARKEATMAVYSSSGRQQKHLEQNQEILGMGRRYNREHEELGVKMGHNRERKFILTVVERLQRPSSDGDKKDGKHEWRTFSRSKEFDSLSDCIHCIQQQVVPCGQQYSKTSQFGTSTMETVSVEIHNDREVMFSSTSISFWGATFEELLYRLQQQLYFQNS